MARSVFTFVAPHHVVNQPYITVLWTDIKQFPVNLFQVNSFGG